jgi:guanylate kinase
MTEIRRRGLLLVLSSPSGAGKTTITRTLVEAEPDIALSVSVTTRPPREGEIDGTHYHFINQARFDEMVAQAELLEHAVVFGHCYGTPRAPVMAALESGRDIISDVDWQGTQQLKDKVRDDLVSIFILPPSRSELQDRLERRAQDSAEVVASRMEKAADEMSHWAEYDYVILNSDLDESVRQARSILIAERARRERQIGLAEFVNRLRGGP